MQTICETLHGFSQNQDSTHISHSHQQISSAPNTLINYYNGNNNDDGIFEITVWDIDSNVWVFVCEYADLRLFVLGGNTHTKYVRNPVTSQSWGKTYLIPI